MAKDRKKKDAQENGVLKSKKPRKLTRILAVGLAILAICGVVFPVFTACTNTPEPTPTPTPTPTPEPTPIVLAEDVDELMAKYGDNVNAFLENDVLQEIVEHGQTAGYDADKLVDATFDLGDGSASELDSVKTIFTYNVGGDDGNDRYYAINEMTFDSPLDLDDIAEYDEHSTELAQAVADADITTEYSTNYDAGYNYENSDLAQTIYDHIAPDAPDATHLILNYDGAGRGVMGGTIVDVENYTLVAQTDDSVTEYKLRFKEGVSIDEAFSSSDELYTVSSEVVEEIDTPDVYKEYVPEIAHTPVIEVDNLGQLFTEYKTQTENFLKDNTFNAIYDIVGNLYNPDNVKSVRYSVGDNSASTLSSMQVEFTIKNPAVEGNETYYRATINFDSPVSLVDIANNDSDLTDTIRNADVVRDVTFAYNAKDTQLRMDEVVSKLNAMGVSITDDMQVMASFGSNGTCNVAIADNDGYSQYSFTATNHGTLVEKFDNAENVFVEKEYVEDNYEQGGTENPGGDINIDEDAATIAENLQPLQEAINKAAFSNYTMSDIRWDLGEPDQDGNYDSIRIAFVGINKNNNNSTYIVANVDFPYSISANDLVNTPSVIEEMASKIGYNSVMPEYYTTYNPTTLTTEQNNLVDAVADYLITDGYNADLDGTIKLYTNYGPEAAGTVNRFTIIFINDEGIREFNFNTPYNSNLNTMIEYIKNGQATITSQEIVDFSDNQIVVDEINLSEYNEL